MEVIFPWERNDIEVKSTSEDSQEESDEEDFSGAPFAAMLPSPSSRADDEVRIHKIADRIQEVAHSTDMTTNEVLSRLEAHLNERNAPDSK